MFRVLPFKPVQPWPSTSQNRGYDMEIDEDEYVYNPENESGDQITTPGESIADFQLFMRGHGTYVENDTVVSTNAGTIERVNKLISVKPIAARYTPEVGDLLIGRITDVQARRWKVDINARQDAVLQLAAVNLPGGVQRRKLESDELEMRTYFEEGDLLVAEVQQVGSEGGCSLHTRSLRYGKLRNGHLTLLPPLLIRRLQSHFLTLPCGVDILLGLNGYVWLMKHVPQSEQVGEEGFDAMGVYSSKNDDIPPQTRLSISLLSSILLTLARGWVPITDSVISQAYEWVVDRSSSLEEAAKELASGGEDGEGELGRGLVEAAAGWV